MADFSSLLGAAGLGGAIGQAIVRLELDSAKYQAELRAAQAQTAAGTTTMGKAMATLGGVAKAGVGVAGIAIAAFGVNAVRAASDLGEAVNKSNVIFGNNAAEIERWAETGADAFGLSKTAALDAAGGFGAMLQTAGLAVSESADMSTALVELAGDMASFNNIDPTEALEKLRSGLAGEAEPLRRFGVFLSEAAVQQEAYQSGIAKTGEELTEAQKVQARYNIIFDQTTKQQGDFQRTADSLPNTLRSMRAEFENVSAEVGTALLPAVTDLLELLKNLIPVIKIVAENFGLLLTAFVALAAAKWFPAFIESLGLALGALAPAAGAGAGGFKELTEAEAAALETGIEVVDNLNDQAVAASNMKDVLPALSNASDDYVSSLKHVHVEFSNVGEASEDARRGIVSFAGLSGEELQEWRVDAKADLRAAIFSFEDLTTQTDITTRDLIRGFQDMRDEAREFRRAMKELGNTSNEWIPEDFRVYLKDLGPQALIAFADANKRQKERMVEDWEALERDFNRSVGGSFLDLKGHLDDLDKKTTNHIVRIKYDYVGFDPSKPGMGGQQ